MNSALAQADAPAVAADAHPTGALADGPSQDALPAALGGGQVELRNGLPSARVGIQVELAGSRKLQFDIAGGAFNFPGCSRCQ
jgi:hypothetical protein